MSKLPDQFEENYYDDVPEDLDTQIERFEKRAERPTTENLQFVDQEEVVKTSELKFIGGKLHQFVERNTIRHETQSGEFLVVAKSSAWELVPSE